MLPILRNNEAIIKLETHIKCFLLSHVQKLNQVINHEIKILFNDTRNNYFQCSNLDGSIPKFQCSKKLIQETLKLLFQNIPIHFRIRPANTNTHSQNTHRIALNNYWNRYKFEWIGDYFFYPLLKNELFKYIEYITRNYKSIQSKHMRITKQRNEYEQNVTRELLYFQCLQKIMNANIQSQSQSQSTPSSQSLIFEQSYIESDYLSQLFAYLGDEHGVKWWNMLTSNNSYNANKIQTLNKKWIHSIVKIKQNNYDKIVMAKIVNTETDGSNASKSVFSNPKIKTRVPVQTQSEPCGNDLTTMQLNIENNNSNNNNFENVKLITMLSRIVINGNGNNENINQSISQFINNHMHSM